MGSRKLKDVDRFELNYLQAKLVVFQQEAVIRRLRARMHRMISHDDSANIESQADNFEELAERQKRYLAKRLIEIGKVYGVDFSRTHYDPTTGEIRETDKG